MCLTALRVNHRSVEPSCIRDLFSFDKRLAKYVIYGETQTHGEYECISRLRDSTVERHFPPCLRRYDVYG